MPLAAPMKFRMSRTLALVNRMFERLARRRVEHGLGDICARPLAHLLHRGPSAATPRCGRGSSARARATFAAACRLVGSYSDACLYSRSATSRSPLRFRLAGRDRGACATRSASTRSRAILYSGLSGIGLHRLAVVRDGGVPVATRARPPRRGGTPCPPRSRPATAANAARHTSVSVSCRLTRRLRVTTRTAGSSAVRGRPRASSRSTPRRSARSGSGPR